MTSLRRGIRLGLMAVLALLLLGAPISEAAPRPRKIKTDGRWHRVEIKAIEQVRQFTFPTLAGARYRLTLERKSLTHPVIRAGVGGGASVIDLRPPGGESPIVHEWAPERDQLLTLSVGGFSAFTGKARIKVEALGPDGKGVKQAFRWLDVADPKPRYGDLILGEANVWELVTRVGERYEILPDISSGSTLRLRVLDRAGREIATSDTWRRGDRSIAPVRFEAPVFTAETPPEGSGKRPAKPAARLTLEVEGLHASSGQYRLTMRKLRPGVPLAPEEDLPAEVEGPSRTSPTSGTVTLRAGDFALVFLPPDSQVPQLPVRRRVADGRLVALDSTDAGRLSRGHAPGYGNFMGLRARVGGTFHIGYQAHLPPGASLTLYPRERLADAPILTGTAKDATVRARVPRKEWRTIGLGLCMPDVVYLFVAVGAPGQGVAMRITDLEGKALATRPSRGAGLPFVPGHGPSQRFRVKRPQLVRLQVRGSKVLATALLRQLQGSGR